MNPHDERDIDAKNRIYDYAVGPIWQKLVYEPVHGGLELANIGGVRFLDELLTLVRATSAPIAELCSGSGACCLYLAQHCPSNIVGIDVNMIQVMHSRKSLSDVDPDIRARIHFEQCDVRFWEPREQFGCIFSLDSLVLVPDLDVVLARARQALLPDGILAIADVTAGPRCTPELRRYAWEEDGMINLESAEALAERVRRAGLEVVDIGDWTDQAAATFTRIAEATQARRQEVIAVSGLAAWQDWDSLSRRYRDSFAERALGYTRILARHP